MYISRGHNNNILKMIVHFSYIKRHSSIINFSIFFEHFVEVTKEIGYGM